ncbi:hypothetical protein [Streptomyces sp. NPDC047841]
MPWVIGVHVVVAAGYTLFPERERNRGAGGNPVDTGPGAGT